MSEVFFKLKGKTLVIIDWANVYGWFDDLKWKINPEKLFKFLKSHNQVKDIRIYFGTERGNKKSVAFNKDLKDMGYSVVSKYLKWVPVSLDRAHFKTFFAELVKITDGIEKNNSDDAQKLRKLLESQIKRRKCDFDCEIAIDVMNTIDKIDSLILFSGDGDYAILVNELIKRNKQAIVVFAKGHKGIEYEDFKKGLFLCSVERLKEYLT